MKIIAYVLFFQAAAALTAGTPALSAEDGRNAALSNSGAIDSLADLFLRPPADARILKIIHNLPDASEDQDRLFAQLQSQGMGGMVVNVSFQEYMASEAKWGAFVRGVQEAKRRGMSLWLYDECGYPSGAAGGLALRDHPEYEARGLLVAESRAVDGVISLDAPPGSLFQAVAAPIREGALSLKDAVDISSALEGGRIVWQAPEGDWHGFVFTESVLYEGTHAALSLAYKLPYINLLAPEPTARFIEVTHEEYARRLGQDLGVFFTAAFTDEPSLMSLFLAEQPWRALPWSSHFSDAFQQRRGYDMKPLLPALFADAGAEGTRFRYDFWKTVGELVSENYFGQLQDWCRKHNFLSGGHLLAEESFLSGIPLYGNFFQCLRRMDAPSMDCLTSIPEETPWHVARLVSSAAALEGRSVTMSETSDHSQRYRSEGDERPVRVVSEAEIRGTCNRLILNGINVITSYYSFEGLDDEALRRINEWVGRCSAMLRGGRQVADIALVYPVESAWTRFTPATRWVVGAPAEAHRIEQVFHDAEKDLYLYRRDFTHVDASALIEATVDGDALVHGELRWRVVVLPDVDTLPLAAWEKLSRFHQAGGVVIALVSRPANSECDFPSPQVLALSKAMFGEEEGAALTTTPAGGAGVFLPRGMETLLPMVLDAILERDGGPTDPKAPLRTTHRCIDGSHVYFVINDSAAPWEGAVDLPAAGAVEQWDPASGTMTPRDDGRAVPLRLDGYGGMIYRFQTATTPHRRQIQEIALPRTASTSLPETEPVVLHGQFAPGCVEEDAALSASSGKAWRASALLTKGNVDTFLFVGFEYSPAVDLGIAACVTLELWLPSEQKAAVPMLVVLRDESGVEYYAEAGVPMNAAGRFTIHAPLHRFQRAGWSGITDKALNLKAISTIRIGWGGYLGAENETVVFSCSAPRLLHTE